MRRQMGQRILVKVLCESIVTIFNPQIRYKSDTFSFVRKKMSFLCMVFFEILDRQLFPPPCAKDGIVGVVSTKE